MAAALAKVAKADKEGSWQSWRDRLGVCDALLERVVDQTRRRVFDGETVPAKEKVASLFEPHTDIIVKGGRGTCHGHKVNLATGRSGLALDAVVEDGNPADSARCLPMPERHVAHCGSAPTHAAFDGGHVSRHNVEAARELGVRHKHGLPDTQTFRPTLSGDISHTDCRGPKRLRRARAVRSGTVSQPVRCVARL